MESSKAIKEIINNTKEIADSTPISSIAIVFFSKNGTCYTNAALDNGNVSMFELLGGITYLRLRIEHKIERDPFIVTSMDK